MHLVLCGLDCRWCAISWLKFLLLWLACNYRLWPGIVSQNKFFPPLCCFFQIIFIFNHNRIASFPFFPSLLHPLSHTPTSGSFIRLFPHSKGSETRILSFWLGGQVQCSLMVYIHTVRVENPNSSTGDMMINRNELYRLKLPLRALRECW